MALHSIPTQVHCIDCIYRDQVDYVNETNLFIQDRIGVIKRMLHIRCCRAKIMPILKKTA